jgi:hypothetical protein
MLPQHIKYKVRTYRGRYHYYPFHCNFALFSVLLKSLCDPAPMRPRKRLHKRAWRVRYVHINIGMDNMGSTHI